jgi:5'(3')-deoxyribonucleotidase
MENIALVDMDGTLADFRGALDRDLRARLGDDLEKLSPKTLQQVEYLIRGQGGWYRNLKPLPLGFALVKMLQSIGFRIMIMTKSSMEAKNAWTEKVEWISQHLPEADMMVTQDKGIVYGKVLVDDYPGHFLRWLEHRPRGVVVMPRQPWNKEIEARENIHPVSPDDDLSGLKPVLEAAYRR